MKEKFDIPVVVFFFKRPDLILKVIERVKEVQPKKMYLFSDGGRTAEEQIIVEDCRKQVEKAISWECEVVKNYASKNRGVYESIGKGALWVFQREEKAIFLEDDNLPEITFFYYCKEMLNLYENDSRVLWVCGTNYLEKYRPEDGSSYSFTQQLLPCGWASWARKFTSMYDGDLKLLEEDKSAIEKFKNTYACKALFNQQLYSVLGTKDKLLNHKRVSWDHQMNFSLRMNSALGIAPCYNQIKNIGADERSTHGGTSLNKIMTKRFCGIESYPLEFPLKHPRTVVIDPIFEKKTQKIILLPLNKRIINRLVRLIKPIFGFGKYDSVSISAIKNRMKNK